MSESDEDHREEDYEYEYSDEDGGPGDEDVSMDGSSDAADAAASSPTQCMPNKKRPFGSMVDRRKNCLGDNPNAPPLSGGEFDFRACDSPLLEWFRSSRLQFILTPTRF
jgi:hypothetical protein